jgi:hypothetical protein
MYYEMFVLRNHENYFSEKNRARGVNWVVVSEFNSVEGLSLAHGQGYRPGISV